MNIWKSCADDEDRKIVAHYNKMPYHKPTYQYESSNDNYGDGSDVIVVIVIISMILGMLILISTNVEDSKQEIAESIYGVQMGEFACKELKNMLNRPSFATHYLLIRAVEKQLVSDGCMSQYEIQEKKDIHYCLTHDTVTCRVDALKNPEKYITREPFNTKGR